MYIDRYVVGTRAKKEKRTGFQTKTRQLLSFSSSFAYFLLLFSLFILNISCSSISHSSRCAILKIQFQLHTTKLHNAALLCLRMIEFCLRNSSLCDTYTLLLYVVLCEIFPPFSFYTLRSLARVSR